MVLIFVICFQNFSVSTFSIACSIYHHFNNFEMTHSRYAASEENMVRKRFSPRQEKYFSRL